MVVVANAIDTMHFHPGAADTDRLDRLAGLPPPPTGTLRVGLVATYARWKGHDVFLKAAAALVREASSVPVRFYVVGGPIYQTQGSQFKAAELHGLVGALGLADRVGFVDFQRDPSEIYRALDVVVHASTRPEPFGLTIVEAMACGRAVIAAQAGGSAELFTHDHDGLGVALGVVGAARRQGCGGCCTMALCVRGSASMRARPRGAASMWLASDRNSTQFIAGSCRRRPKPIFPDRSRSLHPIAQSKPYESPRRSFPKEDPVMISTLLQSARALLASVILLSIPAFALASLLPGATPGEPGAELARGDDPIRNGLRIVEPPVQARIQSRQADAAEEVVTDWSFTDKGKPSPYN